MIKNVIFWLFVGLIADHTLSTEATFSCDTVESSGKKGHERIDYDDSYLYSVMLLFELYSTNYKSSYFSSGDYYMHRLEYPCNDYRSANCVIDWKIDKYTNELDHYVIKITPSGQETTPLSTGKCQKS